MVCQEAIEGFAAYRGCQAGCNYAEAFEVVLRRVWKYRKHMAGDGYLA